MSGDFFDYLQGDNAKEIAIVIGDVAGHGMQGAMNAVMTDGVLRMAANVHLDLSPAGLLRELNTVLKDRLEREMNVTMVIGRVNAETHTMTLANAAHHAHPLLVREEQVQPLSARGMPLGMMAEVAYREAEFQLQSGDVIVFMTDGIIEAHDGGGNKYQDTERLQRVTARLTPDMAASAMIDALIEDVLDFTGSKTEQEDDMTVVVVKVLCRLTLAHE